ncbi:MAG TPA: hypothetical protein VMU30_03380 [Bacteroidota bacterium]|nr:hypothetical protein [Bacteroidota bacterium]
MKKVFFIVMAMIGGASFTFSQDVQLTAKINGDTFRLGDWIDVAVDGKINNPIDTIAPAVKDSIGSFELVSTTRDGANPKWTLRVTSTDSGRVFLPPIPFAYKLKGDTATRIAYTNSFFLSLTGLSINPQGEIKDIKSPLWAPWLFEDFLPYILFVFLICAVSGAFYFFYWRKRKTGAAEEVKVVIPPHREALTALRVVEEKKLWQQGAVKEYYTETTEIIRRFFEKRWNIIALEMTTDDILDQMKHVPESLPIWKEIETFFCTADMVKFAKSQPSPSDHENEMKYAYDIVRSMVPKTPIVEQHSTPSPEQIQQEENKNVR